MAMPKCIDGPRCTRRPKCENGCERAVLNALLAVGNGLLRERERDKVAELAREYAEHAKPR